MLPVPYFMLTFTVPGELRTLAYREQGWFYDLMFEAVAGVLRDFSLDPHHFGGTPGFTAVLHTWTRQMQHHPHVHVIMPGVALSKDGLRIRRAKHRKYLFPVKALGAAFRNRMSRLIRERDAKAQTKHFPQIERAVWSKPWVVDGQGVGKGETALRYLARYVNKTAISEQRLLGYDEEGRIRLNCQDSESGHWRVMTLSADEFLRRWCLHVLPKGLMRIRHYGFLSAAARKKYERIHEILQSRPLPRPRRLESEKPKCPCCGKDMVLLRVIERWPKRTFLSRAPPQGVLSQS